MKNSLKKFICLLLICSMIFSLCACGNEDVTDDVDNKTFVRVTDNNIFDFINQEMEEAKYYVMLDMYVEFYSEYIKTASNVMCASVMLDVNNLPVLVLVSETDDEVCTFSFYGFEKDEVVLISSCNSQIGYSRVYTDGIIMLYDGASSDWIWYQIKDNQMYKIKETNSTDDGTTYIYYMDGKKILEDSYNEDIYYTDELTITVDDDSNNLYDEEIENLWIEYYSSIYGENFINDFMEWRNIYSLKYIGDSIKLALFYFYELDENGYGNNYSDFQRLVSDLKEVTEINQKEFYITSIKFLAENRYIEYDNSSLKNEEFSVLLRDTSWLPDLMEMAQTLVDSEEIVEGVYDVMLYWQSVAPVPNVSYSSEEIYGEINNTATKSEKFSILQNVAYSIAELKFEEIKAEYESSNDIIDAMINWWKSDEYISTFATALNTRIEYVNALSEESTLIGYWECGEDMLKIYHGNEYEDDDEYVLTIRADINEEADIPVGNYLWSSYYDFYFDKSVECVTIDVSAYNTYYESEAYDSTVYFDMLMNYLDDDTIELKYTPYYYDEDTDENVYLETATKTFTRMNLTEEEIKEIELQAELEEIIEKYIYYYEDSIIASDGAMFPADITGDGIPEIFEWPDECYTLSFINEDGEVDGTDICSQWYYYELDVTMQYSDDGIIKVSRKGDEGEEIQLYQFNGTTVDYLHGYYHYTYTYIDEEETYDEYYVDEDYYESYDEAWAVFDDYYNADDYKEINWMKYDDFVVALKAFAE